MKKKIICFDLDNVICRTKKNFYKLSSPNKTIIQHINKLYKKGYIIKIFTARFMGRANDDSSKARKLAKNLTLKQLKNWKLNYHQVIFGKPSYDVIVDDKSFDFKKNWFKKFVRIYK